MILKIEIVVPSKHLEVLENQTILQECTFFQTLVSSLVIEDFFVKFKLRNKVDGFEWLLVFVYGAAQENKGSRLTRLSTYVLKKFYLF
jgi:hypothetical protein